MHKLPALLYAALFMSTSVAAIAAPNGPAPQAEHSSLTLVDGWWEQSHQVDTLRQRYWHLPPEQRARYDQLQFQIQQLQQEQHRILRFGEWERRDHDGRYGPQAPPPPYGQEPYGRN